MHPTGHNSRTVTKSDKLYFEDIKCSVKVKDIHKIKKKVKTSKVKDPVYVSKKCFEEKYIYLL